VAGSPTQAGTHVSRGSSEPRAARDQVGVVLLGVSGDQDHHRRRQIGFALQPPNDIEAALPTQVDVDQADVGPELRGASPCVRMAAADSRCPVSEFGADRNDARRRECHRGFTAVAVHITTKKGQDK